MTKDLGRIKTKACRDWLLEYRMKIAETPISDGFNSWFDCFVASEGMNHEQVVKCKFYMGNFH